MRFSAFHALTIPDLRQGTEDCGLQKVRPLERGSTTYAPLPPRGQGYRIGPKLRATSPILPLPWGEVGANAPGEGIGPSLFSRDLPPHPSPLPMGEGASCGSNAIALPWRGRCLRQETEGGLSLSKSLGIRESAAPLQRPSVRSTDISPQRGEARKGQGLVVFQKASRPRLVSPRTQRSGDPGPTHFQSGATRMPCARHDKRAGEWVPARASLGRDDKLG